MRKITPIIITVLLLISAAGCQSRPFTVSNAFIQNIKQNSLPDDIAQTELLLSKNIANPSDSYSSSDKEQYTFSPSDMIIGWQKLNAETYLHEMTYYKDDKVLAQFVEDRTVSYTLDVPGSWTLKDTVFFENGQKAAELIPIFLLELDEGSDLNFIIPEEYTEDELISLEKISFGENEGYKIILEVKNRDTWYPHTYYLTNGRYVFGIVLYSYSEERDSFEQMLFDDIASSFRFKP